MPDTEATTGKTEGDAVQATGNGPQVTGRRGLRIGIKLELAFAAVLTLMGIALGVSMQAGARQAEIAATIVGHLDPARTAARDIVTLVRAIDDDGAWYVNALPGDPAHAATLLATYYDEVDALRATVDLGRGARRHRRPEGRDGVVPDVLLGDDRGDGPR